MIQRKRKVGDVCITEINAFVIVNLKSKLIFVIQDVQNYGVHFVENSVNSKCGIVFSERVRHFVIQVASLIMKLCRSIGKG